ncbi:MAG TPA: RNA polymerase sigma factor [Candidatus Limnocylindrales bacterium]|nr:RNA polymerase sigma factor [Candidatus Limnocylindrales bacterium]
MSRVLVERAQAGDRDAYEQLARGAARRLFLVASRILGDIDEAEDAVQRTLLAMWQDLPRLRDPDRFEAWTYRMVVHQCRNAGRRERRMGVRVVDLNVDLRSNLDHEGDVVLHDQLRRAFDNLSPDHRTVVVLRHLVGMPIGDIAEVTGVPAGTVASRLHHAMRAMRASIDAGERLPEREGQPA